MRSAGVGAVAGCQNRWHSGWRSRASSSAVSIVRSSSLCSRRAPISSAGGGRPSGNTRRTRPCSIITLGIVRRECGHDFRACRRPWRRTRVRDVPFSPPRRAVGRLHIRPARSSKRSDRIRRHGGLAPVTSSQCPSLLGLLHFETVTSFSGVTLCKASQCP